MIIVYSLFNVKNITASVYYLLKYTQKKVDFCNILI